MAASGKRQTEIVTALALARRVTHPAQSLFQALARTGALPGRSDEIELLISPPDAAGVLAALLRPGDPQSVQRSRPRLVAPDSAARDGTYATNAPETGSSVRGRRGETSPAKTPRSYGKAETGLPRPEARPEEKVSLIRPQALDGKDGQRAKAKNQIPRQPATLKEIAEMRLAQRKSASGPTLAGMPEVGAHNGDDPERQQSLDHPIAELASRNLHLNGRVADDSEPMPSSIFEPSDGDGGLSRAQPPGQEISYPRQAGRPEDTAPVNANSETLDGGALVKPQGKNGDALALPQPGKERPLAMPAQAQGAEISQAPIPRRARSRAVSSALDDSDQALAEASWRNGVEPG